jgi:hypothetical protein
MRSALTFLIPTVFLIAVIPAAIAWKLDQSIRGTKSDLSFWQLVASSVLQLLSLVTFLWPIRETNRPSLTWVCVWILGGLSTICAVVSVPLYLAQSTIASFVISFAETLGQAVMQLQVVNAIWLCNSGVTSSGHR